MSGDGYLFDNAAAEAGGRFAGLEALFDESTFRHLRARGIGRGSRCWELGAGRGSVARWMAGEVGPEGHVLATDLNPAWIAEETAALVEVRRHDVTVDEIPTAEFDLIHARLVLVHLPERQAITAALAGALRPGGWLVLEEFDRIVPPCPEPEDDDERTYTRVINALLELLHRRGADTTYPRTLPRRLRRAGLSEVGAEGRLVFVPGATPGSDVQRANLRQTGALAVEAGLVTAEDVATFLRLLDDPEFIPAQPLMISAWGRRPPAG